MTLLVCGLATLAALFYVFYIPQNLRVGPEQTRAAFLRERKEAVYENLRDLNFEYKAGKVPDADYASMKSAGAAKKGGTAPVASVLDYPEYSTQSGLNLQCTPGNDVECVTAQVGAGASVVLFTTGLGTPTGNPIAPVVKLSTNTQLSHRMPDIIDFDAGPIINGGATIEETGEQILNLVIQVASGEVRTKAELNHQEDFIPWKRGVSL